MGSVFNFTKFKQLHIPDVVMMGYPYDYDFASPTNYHWTNVRLTPPHIQLILKSLKTLIFAQGMTFMGVKTKFLWEFARELGQLQEEKADDIQHRT